MRTRTILIDNEEQLKNVRFDGGCFIRNTYGDYIGKINGKRAVVHLTYKRETKLTPRQWALHDLLNEYYPRGLTKEEICDILSDYYGDDPTSVTEHRELRRDFQVLRESGTKLMGVYDTYKDEYKRLTPFENAVSIASQKNEINGMARRLREQERRLKLDGQYRIQFNKERDMWEVFPSEVEEDAGSEGGC